MKSFFASPERSSRQEILAEIEIVSSSPIISGVLHTVGGLIAVLNEHRQILAINDSFLKMIGIEEGSGAMGLRPGEALGCVWADEEASGCGTSKYCSTCGAAVAIVTSLKEDTPVEKICALTAVRGE